VNKIDRAKQVMESFHCTCSGYPCDPIKQLAVLVAQGEEDKARLTTRISELTKEPAGGVDNDQ